MGWKKLIIGEKLPDKDDPKYKKQYEKEVQAGKSAAKALGVDKAAIKTQQFAIKYPKLFLVIVFGFVICCLGFNIYRMVKVYNQPATAATATSRQDDRLRQKMKHIPAAGRKLEQDVSGSKALPHDYSVEEIKNMKGRVEALIHKEGGMNHEDSVLVKRLLEKLMQSNNLKSE